MIQIYKRYLEKSIKDDLKSKMVFIGGPRQVGKTTFALTFLSDPTEKHPAYLNWDDINDRKALLKGELPPNEKCVILDEIHKFARWRNLIKGFYDKNRSEIEFIITDPQGWTITAKEGTPFRDDIIITGFTHFL